MVCLYIYSILDFPLLKRSEQRLYASIYLIVYFDVLRGMECRAWSYQGGGQKSGKRRRFYWDLNQIRPFKLPSSPQLSTRVIFQARWRWSKYWGRNPGRIFPSLYKTPWNLHEKRVLKRGLTLTKGTPLKTKIGADFTEIYRKSDKLMPMWRLVFWSESDIFEKQLLIELLSRAGRKVVGAWLTGSLMRSTNWA